MYEYKYKISIKTIGFFYMRVNPFKTTGIEVNFEIYNLIEPLFKVLKREFQFPSVVKELKCASLLKFQCVRLFAKNYKSFIMFKVEKYHNNFSLD